MLIASNVDFVPGKVQVKFYFFLNIFFITKDYAIPAKQRQLQESITKISPNKHLNSKAPFNQWK